MPVSDDEGIARSMNFIKKNLTTILLIAVGLLGAGLIAYPTFSDWWNSFHQSRAVASYAQSVAGLSSEKYDEIILAAEEYNKKLSETGMLWTMDEAQQQEYENTLDVNDTGIMGYINIPKIDVTLPIYHGTDEAVLQIAIGHLSGTSLPVGGESTHCVVSGHRGLPSAKLFTNLDRLVEGDTWTMTALNRTVTYEADQIRIVEPSDLSSLTIEEGKDYCTLVTCTPYGINTHRLLVRGHRVANAQGDANVVADAMQTQTKFIAVFVGVPILLILFITMMIVTGRKKKLNSISRKAYAEFWSGDEKHRESSGPRMVDEFEVMQVGKGKSAESGSGRSENDLEEELDNIGDPDNWEDID